MADTWVDRWVEQCRKPKRADKRGQPWRRGASRTWEKHLQARATAERAAARKTQSEEFAPDEFAGEWQRVGGVLRPRRS